MTDTQLLDQFVTTRSEAAFGELVSRHIGWIQATARRRLHDPGLAEDATQAVFILLAQKAASLRRETVLSAWLFSTLRFTCLAIARSERRRKTREDEAAAMREAERSTDEVWGELSGQLDEVVAKLSGSDRRAVLLRFYESKTYGEVASVLGISEEAARKRVQRAVDKLQGMFQRRGVSFSSGAIGAAMLTHVAPGGAGVATTSVASAALSAASGSSAAVAKTAGGLIAFAQAKAAAIVIAASVAVVAAGGTAVVVAKSKSAKTQAVVFAAPAATIATREAPTTTAPAAAAEFAAGKIFDADEKPVAGAKIDLIGQSLDAYWAGSYKSLASTVSGADGSFRVDSPQKMDGGGSVLIDAPPWAYGVGYITSDAEQAVQLSAPITVEATLLFPDGSPAAGVEVAPQQCNGGDQLTTFWAVDFPEDVMAKLAQRTDAQGKCRFERIPEKTNLILNVRDARFAKLTYWDGINVREEALTVGKPITLRPAGSISGKLVDPDGTPLAHVTVFAQSGDNSGRWGAADTDADGVYHIDRLGPARYALTTRVDAKLDPQQRNWAAPARVGVMLPDGAALKGVDIPTVRGVLVKGKVTLKDTGAPAANVWVGISGPGQAPNGSFAENTQTHADGTYVFRVPPGKQQVYLYGDVAEGYAVPGAHEVVAAEGTGATVNFALPRAKGKPVSGVVKLADGSPAAGAWVAAQGPDQSPMEQTTVKANAQGKFTFAVLPAKVTLRATRGLLRSVPVEVSGDRRDVQMQVQKFPPINLKGRVVDAGGNGIAGASVNLQIHYGGGGYSDWLTEVLTDAQGNYTVTGMLPGEMYSVFAFARRFGEVSANVAPKPGETTIQQPAIVLPRANSMVSGTVVDEAGEPVVDVDVEISGATTKSQQMKTDGKGAFEFVDVVEGEKLYVRLIKNHEYLDGGNIQAGTVGAEIVFKSQNKK